MPAERGSDKGETPLRLFYAVLLPSELREVVADVQGRLRRAGARVKWVEPNNLHFTLKFLGDVPPALVPELERAGQETGRLATPVGVELTGVGAFPNLRNPRVVWVGTGSGATTLTDLARTLARALRDAGLVLGDDKPFAAHCTIGRCRGPAGADFAAVMEREAASHCGRLEAAEFHLMRSELSRSGPEYTSLARFALTASPGCCEPEHEGGGSADGSRPRT